MNDRELRGLQLAACKTIKKTGSFWIVPSQSADRKQYVVNQSADEVTSCTCPDHESRGVKCKHMHAVEIVIKREENPDGSVTITEAVRTTEIRKTTYRQAWPAYNAAQVNEKRKFQELLRDLCQGIAEPAPKATGRPSVPLRDSIFAACFKIYSTVSGRRFMTDLEEAKSKGYIERLPCYNTIFRILESPATTGVLVGLVLEASRPLKAIESTFACDSTGFSGCRFDRWYDAKYGKDRVQRAWVKTHAMVGTKTNVITAIEISGSGDAPQLPPLLTTTAQRFDVREVCADLAYSSRNNLKVINELGAVPYIPFKRNANDDAGGLWARLFHFFSFNKDEFLPRYHQRSNAESTFSMVKAKFGDSVRSKTDVAMKNEVLAKCVCHNICCLISAMYELGLDPVFWPERQPEFLGSPASFEANGCF